jgi:predicted nucleic acid-binding protein
VIYLDTSAFIKLYIREEHSEAVNRVVIGQDEPLPVWFLHLVEMRNALNLKLFRGELAQADVDGLAKLFQDRLHSGIYAAPRLDIGDLTSTAIQLSGHTRLLGCRSLDILHVAAAKSIGAQRFVTFDERQRRLAETAGLAAC